MCTSRIRLIAAEYSKHMLCATYRRLYLRYAAAGCGHRTVECFLRPTDNSPSSRHLTQGVLLCLDRGTTPQPSIVYLYYHGVICLSRLCFAHLYDIFVYFSYIKKKQRSNFAAPLFAGVFNYCTSLEISSAKFSCFFSMPSPLSKRVKALTTIVPPSPFATSSTCLPTDILSPLTKACCKRQFSS